MADLKKTFSANLNILVNRKGTSVSAQTRDMELNRSLFHRYMRGVVLPSLDTLNTMCNYYDVPAEVFRKPLEELDPEKFG